MVCMNMRRALFVFFAFLAGCPALWAAGEIQISQVTAKEIQPNRFEFFAQVKNSTQEPREVVLRAQVGVFDRTVPKGEQPLSLARKDFTIILKPGEERGIHELFVGEGSPPHGATRFEPTLRVRRQRIWKY